MYKTRFFMNVKYVYEDKFHDVVRKIESPDLLLQHWGLD